MREGEALYQAILDAPEEDAPRLVYADWLEDQGGADAAALAEFIRLQIELERLKQQPDTPAVVGLRREHSAREKELLKAHRKRWEARLRGRKGPLSGPEASCHFRRGFPGFAWATAHRLLAEGDALFRLAPITQLSVRDVTGENLAALLACPWMARVRRLTLRGPYEGGARPDVAVLADALHWAGPASLWLEQFRCTPQGAARFAAAGPAPALRELSLSNTYAHSALGPLFSGTWAARLTAFYSHGCALSGADVEALEAAPVLAGLKELSLAGQPVAAEALAALSRAGFWPELEALVLWNCSVGDEGAAALAARPTRLSHLDLKWNPITTAGVAALAAGPALASVEQLEFAYALLGDAGAAALAASPHAEQLRELYLARCEIGPQGARSLAQAPRLSGLRRLNLDANPLGAEGVLALAESPYLAGLDRLSVIVACGIRGKARQKLKEHFGDRVTF
jgi:uncharacterized protein (TIGR02996 family)